MNTPNYALFTSQIIKIHFNSELAIFNFVKEYHKVNTSIWKGDVVGGYL